MKITPHFDRKEFDQPARHGLPSKAYPQEWIESRLRPLCEALEKIREALGGKSIRILSGYRSPAYNAKIGGAKTSQHMAGRACDIVVPGMHAKDVHAKVLQLYQAGELDIGGLGLYNGFVHVDVRKSERLAQWSGARTAEQTGG